MASKVLEAGGRVFVSEDFVDEVLDLFPDTNFPVGTGYRVYLGKTANDLVLFTEHSPVQGIKGIPFVMTCPGGFSYAQGKIDRAKEFLKRNASVTPSGLYGYTKAVQGCCEGAIRKLERRASQIVRGAVGKDERVVDFLQRHAKRNQSRTAKVLLGAYKASLPKIAAIEIRLTSLAKSLNLRVGGAPELGMYGFPVRTVKLGLSACSDLHEAAGSIVAGLHNRKPDLYENVVGFLGKHAREAGCLYSRLLSSCYPDC